MARHGLVVISIHGSYLCPCFLHESRSPYGNAAASARGIGVFSSLCFWDHCRQRSLSFSEVCELFLTKPGSQLRCQPFIALKNPTCFWSLASGQPWMCRCSQADSTGGSNRTRLRGSSCLCSRPCCLLGVSLCSVTVPAGLRAPTDLCPLKTLCWIVFLRELLSFLSLCWGFILQIPGEKNNKTGFLQISLVTLREMLHIYTYFCSD